jgi:phosphinothricin acetyltransferase
MPIQITAMTALDWEQVRQVYLEGIATGQATFETEAPDFERWHRTHLPFARLVARDGQIVKGWAALSPVSSRTAYAGVAETSIYVGNLFRGEGIGSRLLESLISESERNGIWTLQAAVFPDNEASVALHKRRGFVEVGRRERISKLNGVWRDTILLERRSNVVGLK